MFLSFKPIQDCDKGFKNHMESFLNFVGSTMEDQEGLDKRHPLLPLSGQHVDRRAVSFLFRGLFDNLGHKDCGEEG